MIVFLFISFFFAISESQSTKVITTTSGMTAILPCVFQSKETTPVYSVKWTTGEDIIFSYKETRSPKESFSERWAINLKLRGNIPAGDATITLLNVTEDDKGEYICRVSENYLPKKDIKITLQVRPKEEPKNPKGDNIDDAQRQGLSTTMAVLPFVSSSKSDSPRVNSPKESILQRPWIIALISILVFVVLFLAGVVLFVMKRSKKAKQHDYRQEGDKEMKEVTASSLYEDMRQTQPYPTEEDESGKYWKYSNNPTYKSSGPDPSRLYENTIIKT
uniref:uncharacterized protein n=1 Tax=Myxine glutinosa TaxID=7769 RepID=UPI0035902288